MVIMPGGWRSICYTCLLALLFIPEILEMGEIFMTGRGEHSSGNDITYEPGRGVMAGPPGADARSDIKLQHIITGAIKLRHKTRATPLRTAIYTDFRFEARQQPPRKGFPRWCSTA